MHEQPQIEISPPQPPERGQFSFALFVAAAAVVIVLSAFYLWPGRQSPSRGTPETHPPFGPAERAYAPKIHFENLGLSRAENFLNQEVTILNGDAVNTGDRALSELEMTVEFVDQMNQIALREARSIVSATAAPLAPGERRTLEISFEHIPATWNLQFPFVRVTGLRFAATK
jgi:hypothetical protein